MELQQSTGPPPQPSSFIEWAVARKEKSQGPHKALLPVVKSTPSGTLAVLIEANGLGDEGMELAKYAATVWEDYTYQALTELFNRCEHLCRGTSGVAVSAVLINSRSHSISWCGAGNVQGVLFHRNAAAEPRYHRLITDNALLGSGSCILREMRVPVKPGDLVIFASDGVSPKFVDALPIDGKPRLVADELLANHCKEDTDCALVLVRYLGN